MYAITFFQGIVLYATISTLYREQRGLTLSDYALIESFSYFFTLAFEVPFGYVADRIGYKRTLVLANGFYFASKLVFWQAHGFAMFLAERFLLSLAFAGLSGVDSSILYLSSGEGESRKNFGRFAAFGTAGMLTGCVVFTLFLSQHYTACAFGTVVTYGIAFALSLLIDEVKGSGDAEDRVTTENLAATIKITLKDGKFLGFLFAAALLTNAGQLISVMINQDRFLQVGIREQQMGVIAIAISVAGLFAAAADSAAKRVGTGRLLSLFCLAMAAAALWMGATRFALAAVLCNFFIDVGSGMMAPLISEIENRRVSVSDRATQLSVYGMVVDVISIGLSVVASQVAKLSFFSLFVLAAAEFLLALLLIQICQRKKVFA